MVQIVLNIEEPGDSYPRFQLNSDGSIKASPDGTTNVNEGFLNLAPAFQQSGTATASPGVYVQPQSEQAGTLTSGLSSGTAYTALLVTATPFPILAGTTLQITYSGNTQNVTVSGSSTIPAGSTSIPVTSFTPTANYLSSSPVNLIIFYNIFEVADKNGAPIMWVSNAGDGIGTGDAPIVCTNSSLVAVAGLYPDGNVVGQALASTDDPSTPIAVINAPNLGSNENYGITQGSAGPPLIGQRCAYSQITSDQSGVGLNDTTWTQLSSTPSIMLPYDGNTYRVDMFAHVSLASAAICAVGFGASSSTILASAKTNIQAFSTFVTASAYVLADTTPQALTIFGISNSGTPTMALDAGGGMTAPIGPTFLAATRVL